MIAAIATAAGASAEAVDFERDVAPLLVRHCIACHNPSDPAGRLDLTAEAHARAGGDSGTGGRRAGRRRGQLRDRADPRGRNAARGQRHARAAAADWPGSKPGSPAGAAWPADRVLSAFEFTTERAGRPRLVVARRPRCAPRLPGVRHADRLRTPIDAFVLARLEAAGLEPSPEADRATFIRRVIARLARPAADAGRDRGVRRRHVAATPTSGWSTGCWPRPATASAGPGTGSTWCASARANGYETNTPRPNAWPYRDWVIAAFNDDLPYPQFVLRAIGRRPGRQRRGHRLPGGRHARRSAQPRRRADRCSSGSTTWTTWSRPRPRRSWG